MNSENAHITPIHMISICANMTSEDTHNIITLPTEELTPISKAKSDSTPADIKDTIILNY